MKLRATVLSAFLLYATAASAQPAGQATGSVYHDQNSNGARDAGEPGMAEVAVSNGEAVTRTDAEGRYRLPVSGGDVLFVIKPSGWRVPLDAQNRPQFYYLHKPDGSPGGTKYAGVAPTGPLPEEVNFPLVPSEEPEHFRALVFGDPQPRSMQEVDYFARDIVNELIGVEDVAFGISLGDIAFDNLEVLEPVAEATAQVGVPWYYVFGNHDMNFDAKSDRLADETFERIFGPADYAFVYGAVHFLVLDNVLYPKAEGKGYEGGLREDQFAFVESYLDHVPEADLAVLATHIPVSGMREADRERLLELLAEQPRTLSLSGHWHTQRHAFLGREEGWPRDSSHHQYSVGTTSGGWWSGMKDETGIPPTMMRDGTPNGYAFVTFDGTDYVIDYKVAGRPASYRMNIHSPRQISRSADTTESRLTVNVFNGNEKTKVAYRLGKEGPWTSMQKVSANDPFFDTLYQRWQRFEKIGLLESWKSSSDSAQTDPPGTPVPSPQESTHLWQAPLPARLPAGRQRVEVRVTDMFGRSFTDVHTFRVVE